MNEEWKPILNYEKYYKISNFGNVKRLCKNKEILLNPYLSSRKDYYMIDLSINNIRKALLVHRLVALHFIDNPNNLPYVNHIDRNGLNNNIKNLEWVSQLENMCHHIKSKKTSSNLTGVCFNKNANKWKSRIRFNKKSIHLGYFNTEEEAYNARVNFEKENNINNKYL